MIENPTEWFQNKTVELESNLKKKEVLQDMKSVILNAEKSVLKAMVRNVSANPIFECLNTADDQEIELICTILFELLSQMTSDELLEAYGGPVQKCLSHSLDEVKATFLKLLDRTVHENAVELLLTKHIPLLVDAVGCLSSEERGTAQGAISLLIKVGSNRLGLKALYSSLVLEKLKEIMLISDAARFRVYEIIVAVSKLSAENLSSSVSSGIMDKLISEAFSDDILIQLNALEILSSLATSNHGLTYLQEHKVLQYLIDKLLRINEEPLSLVLLPGLIEFFGNLCALQPEHFIKQYPQVMDLLFNSLETPDEILLGVIISTVGKIGSTQCGRLALNKYDHHMKYFFSKIGKILTKKNNLTISSLNSVGELIRNLDDNMNMNDLTKTWFNYINPNALESIVNLAKLPFVEFKLAAFSLLKAIATQEWGTEKISNYPGMIEFLTDRSSEFNKDCKLTKFEIIFNMMQCSNIEQVVSQQVFHDLKEFIKEGPFYVPVQVEMATEGAM